MKVFSLVIQYKWRFPKDEYMSVWKHVSVNNSVSGTSSASISNASDV